MIAFYNSEVNRYKENIPNHPQIDDFLNNDPTKISWDRKTKNDLKKHKSGIYSEKKIRTALYRPFVRQWLYFDRQFNAVVSKMFDIFPASNTENLAICVSGIGASKDFSALMVNIVPNLHFLDTCQCFPLYRYEDPPKNDLYAGGNEPNRIDNIPGGHLRALSIPL